MDFKSTRSQFFPIIAFALLLCAGILAATPSLLGQTGSQKLEKFVHQHRIRPFELETQGLDPLPWTEEQLSATLRANRHEKLEIPTPEQGRDRFNDTVFRFERGGGFVVLRTGGFAGVFEVYGTGKLPIPPQITR